MNFEKILSPILCLLGFKVIYLNYLVFIERELAKLAAVQVESGEAGGGGGDHLQKS